ncbi:hypothetical protein L9F63_000868 [Diploptera punctata]|uniref:Uncharacterized protein n=1 Tax=Diploptera punctata TaxID=6984 RepID=A0AAD8ESB1_DIPPU|nr:hypothetical protein L9F63_000868 [Diploptera punctata]
MASYIPSYHVLLFLPLFLLPVTIQCNICLGHLSSDIRCTCPYHCKALFVILSITVSCATISCLIYVYHKIFISDVLIITVKARIKINVYGYIIKFFCTVLTIDYNTFIN